MLTELFAAIAADPSAVPLWAVVAFAAGMYPVGFMLGAPCSPCCAACPCAEGEELPETVTVTLDGFTDKSPGPNLCNLSFSACFGSGAAGHVTAPGGDPATDAGPVAAVTLDDAGSGYAKFGRVAPTLEASGSGSGAEFVVTVTQSQNECGVDEWAVSKVEITKGGTGYFDDEQLVFTVAEGDTIETAATVRLKTERIEPTATIEVASQQGTGAELEVVFAPIAGPPPSWKIDSVTVVDGGDLYVTGDTPTLTLGADTLELSPASFFVKAAHVEPTVSAVLNSSTGSGAAVSVTLTPFVAADGSDVWAVDSIAIDSPGTGYQEWDAVDVEVVDGIARGNCVANVDAVDSSGAIQSIAISPGLGGEYLKGGPITEVAADPHGQYYGNSGVADSVEIDNGGVYYREDESLPPYVAEVSVTITQTLPSAGSGAEISATVNEDKESPDFGKIESLSIDNGGADYLAWEWLPDACCGHSLNGKTFVLQRDNIPGYTAEGSFVSIGNEFVAHQCVYSHRTCGGWHPPFVFGTQYFIPVAAVADHRIVVGYRGPLAPPVAAINRFGLSATADVPAGGGSLAGSGCGAAFTTETLIESCEDFSFSASSEDGQTISVSPGGEYDATEGFPGESVTNCAPCCQGDDYIPPEITVAVVDNRGGAVDISGNHVLSNIGGQRWALSLPSGEQVAVWVDIILCSQIAPDGGCRHCIKKCAVMGMVFTAEQNLVDGRLCGLDEPAKCGAACIDTPICAPPAGVQIPLMLFNNCATERMRITTA